MDEFLIKKDASKITAEILGGKRMSRPVPPDEGDTSAPPWVHRTAPPVQPRLERGPRGCSFDPGTARQVVDRGSVSVGAVQGSDAEPLQAGPWRTQQDKSASEGIGTTKSPVLSSLTSCSPSANPSSPIASNPSSHNFPESFRSGESILVRKDADVRRLPHEVRDHPDADLSSRLEHLWRRSEEIGVCAVVLVESKVKSLSSPVSSTAPLCGVVPAIHWSTLGGDTRSFSQVVQAPAKPRNTMNQRSNWNQNWGGRGYDGVRGHPSNQFWNRGGGRNRGGRGYGNRGNYWNREYRERPQRTEEERQQEVPQPVEEDRQIENNSESVDKEHSGNQDGMANTGQEMERNVSENVRDNRVNQGHNVLGVCIRCGKPGHASDACHNPIICERCNQEGHVARVCMEKMPWDFNVPFFGISAYGQGFHFIKSAVTEEGIKDMSNIALITITEGVATAKQIEAEFRLKAGPESSWRWYAKKIDDNKFQMRFPNAKTIEDVSYFMEMRMRTLPTVLIKVEKWNSSAGSKGPLDSAWFRIRGIPYEKRSYSNVCLVASKVGVPLEVDKITLTKFEYVRVKIGCRDITKVPATVDGVLDFHWHDFHFQREVEQEGYTNPAGNKWIRVSDEKSNDDIPSPKKLKLGTNSQAHNTEAGPSNYNSASRGKKVNEAVEGNKNDTEESEDEGLDIGDLCIPGAEKLSFGNFDNAEISKLTCLTFTEGRSIAINEYGTNMYGGTFDSLAAIEAKRAILMGYANTETELKCLEKDQLSGKKVLSPVMENKDKVTEVERAISMSPIHGTQEPPFIVSSQEEADDTKINEKGNNHINWDELSQDEDVEIHKNQNVDNVTEDRTGQAGQHQKSSEKENKQDKLAVQEWKQVRQSKRGKEQEQKINDEEKSAEKAEISKDEGLKINFNKSEVLMVSQDMIKAVEYAETFNCSNGLQKGPVAEQMEQGAEALKKTALHFHHQVQMEGCDNRMAIV